MSLLLSVQTEQGDGLKAIHMGGVILSPNAKITRERIDPNGNVIDPNTKQVIQKNEPDFVAPAQVSQPEPPVQEDHVSTPSPIAEAIRKQVQQAVQEQIKSIDISAIVAEALKDALR